MRLINLLLLANIGVFGLAVGQQVSPGLAPSPREVLVGNGRWTPTDEQIENRNQGVGWVFGRVVGAAQAPGTPNNSPFGKRVP